MPRRRQRFSQLTRALKEGGAPEAGSRAAGYLAWLQGQRSINVRNEVPATGKDRIAISVIPFGASAGTGAVIDRFETTITEYSLSGIKFLGTIPVTQTGIPLAGVLLAAAGNETEPDFYPALFKVSVYRGTGATTQVTSGITGKPYKTREKRTFALPFGRTTTAKEGKTGATQTDLDKVDELEVFKSLRDAVRGATTEDKKPRSISYDPELYRLKSPSSKTVADLSAAGTISIS